MGRELQTRMDIIFGKFREVVQYFASTHSTCQIFQYIINGNAHGTNAGFAAALVRLDRDYLPVTHAFNRIRRPWVIQPNGPKIEPNGDVASSVIPK